MTTPTTLPTAPTHLSGEHCEGHATVHTLCDEFTIQPHSQCCLLLLQVISVLPQGHLLSVGQRGEGGGRGERGEGREEGRGERRGEGRGGR